MGLSLSHLLLVLVVVLIVFGAGRMPQIMGDLAKGLKAFKKGFTEEETDKDQTDQEGVTPSKRPAQSPAKTRKK